MKFLNLMILVVSLLFCLLSIFFDKLVSLMMFLILLIMYMYLYSMLLNFNYFFEFYMDLFSFMLSGLVIWLLFMLYVFNLNNNNIVYKFNNMMLMFFLMFCFFSNSLLWMYIFFEASLVPIIGLIMMKGMSMERFMATSYLLIYTLFGSFFYLMIMVNTSNIMLISINKFYLLYYKCNVYWALSLLIFLVKMPLYSMHFWLTKAHVEAPVEGSMVLAGIMLKLGGYGLSRFMLFNNNNNLFTQLIIISFSLMGSMVASINCFRNLDLKLIVANSSISHMGMVTASLITCNKMSMFGSLGLMLGHGLCSSSLFFIVNVYYIRSNTRNLLMMKNIIIMLVINSLWLLFNLINMGTPPFLNFFSELILLFCLLKFSIFIIIMLIIILVMNVLFSLNLFLRVCHGIMTNYKYVMKENKLEMFIIFLHFWFLLFYLMKVYLFFSLN